MYTNVIILFLGIILTSGQRNPVVLPAYKMSDVLRITEGKCLLAAVRDPAVGTDVDSELSISLQKLLVAVGGDIHKVAIGTIDYEGYDWPSGRTLQQKGSFESMQQPPDLLFWSRREKDRTCLLTSGRPSAPPPGQTIEGPRAPEALLQVLNEKCGIFRTLDGRLNSAGIHREEILGKLFHVKDVGGMTMMDIYMHKMRDNPFNESHRFENVQNTFLGKISEGNPHCETGYTYGSLNSELRKTCYRYKGQGSDMYLDNDLNSNLENKYNSNNIKDQQKKPSTPSKIAQCEILSELPSTKDFFHQYLKRSKPLIIRNVTSMWQGFTKWTNGYLRREYGRTDVHVKLTPNGDFEGVEQANLWEGFKMFKIPDVVRKQLQFPDLVTVRPAGVNMNFSEFMDIVNKTAKQAPSERTLSAYLEYSSIPDHMPSMEMDVDEPDFTTKLLTRKHFNIWLSDGNTLGRLHFDQFDNLLCQISGTKQVTLFEPHTNAAMYEAHIQQATLSYNQTSGMFRRKHLEDSTSMVMSPVNLLQPDFKRFPLFAGMRPMNCTLNEGDILYLPSYWWHEVQSRPSPTALRNLAVNFWYEPFLTKAFPCPECELDVNPSYRHLLSKDGACFLYS